MRRIAALTAAVLLAAGCAGAAGGDGSATLWVTRDEGREVMLIAEVPAGLTALQALDREADVETRYGGRYVHAINGVEGSLSAGRDWFYFVNGYEADRGAAEYRLRDGDVEWWDFRSWQTRERQSVVVGAFPEPFLHGFAGERREAAVLYEDETLVGVAAELAEVVGAETTAPVGTRPPDGANVLVLRAGGRAFYPSGPEGAPGAAVRLVVEGRGTARRLADDPDAFRFRYEVRP